MLRFMLGFMLGLCFGLLGVEFGGGMQLLLMADQPEDVGRVAAWTFMMCCND